jgi:hypothetical protein
LPVGRVKEGTVVYRDEPYREEGSFAPDDDLVRGFGQPFTRPPNGPEAPVAPVAVDEPDPALLALVPPQPRTLPDTGLSRAF